jgi:hypothetical protein
VYIDPAGDPVLFARALVERGPLLFMGQWALPSQLHGVLSESAGHGLWLLSCGLAVVLAVLLWPLLRREAPARFFALGMLLSLVPSCATFPHDRLLFLAGFGGAGLVALFLGGWWAGADWVPPAKPWRAGAWVLSVLLVGFHLVVAPLGLLRATPDLKAFGAILDRAAESLPGDPAVRTQQVLIVHTPSAFVSIYGLPARALAGRPVAARLRVLGAGVHGLTVERPAPNALVLRPEGGFWSPRGRAVPGGPPPPAFDFRYVLALLDSLYRENPTMRAGERIDLPGLAVKVATLTADGRPDSVTFTFDRPLEDPSYRWLRWDAGVYVPFPLPAVGTSVTLPTPVVPFG